MYFFHSKSPFSNPQNIENNEETTRRLLKKHNVSLPPEGSQHFVSHLDEMNPIAITEAFKSFDGTAGVHQIELEYGDCAVTRLTGPKMGQEDLSDETRTLHSRGEDRPPQPVVVRESPFQYTHIVTLIVFPNEEGQLVLWTMHSGPAMSPDFESEEWKANALGFRSDEIVEGGS